VDLIFEKVGPGFASLITTLHNNCMTEQLIAAASGIRDFVKLNKAYVEQGFLGTMTTRCDFTN